MTTTTRKNPASVTSIEAASTARWLTGALAPARARAKAGPSDEALDRIRARVFGDTAEKKTQRSIAA